MSSIVEIEELGRRIRKLRLERRMTLKHVEQASGLSATHLSEIERGRTSPTIGALVRIARALEKDASYFIESEELSEVAHLPREEVRSFKAGKGVTAEALSRGIPGGRLHAYRLILEGGSEWKSPAQDLEGDSIYLVRRGSIDVRVGDQETRLATGDAVQASQTTGHALRALRGESAEVLALLTRSLDDRP
jgi:transcriptional regulator with XRE-family HTH domain